MKSTEDAHSATRKTGLVWHERFMWHTTGIAGGAMPVGGYIEPGLLHIESPDAKRRIRNLIEVSGLLQHLHQVRPREATEEEILRVHDREYLQRLVDLSAQGFGDAGERAPVGPGSWAIACLAAGGCIEAADAIMAGQIDNAYALVRPAGHHAERGRGRGFCLLSNGGITIEHLRERHGLKRIAVVDFDAHHGNGAQELYFSDPSVLTISIHEESNYPPNSGAISENGAGDGEGCNINVPLPPGSGHYAHLAAMERVVCPALERYQPQMILVSSGFDSCIFDPLARQMTMAETFRLMTRLLVSAAGRLCDRRLLMIHEGGYAEFYTPFCGLAVMEELSGIQTGVEDPFGFHITKPVHTIQPHQAAIIEKAARLVDLIPAIREFQ
ncbi:class II histone deacetylase [Rhizobium sp. CNPSo 4039]|uniref:class II histone deacetylase n=1 Tax=Rhizobium sp. CNPSo 4039 TaxID=3021409 RepID=UPI00254F6DA9|nr:class II histone deacetylase [Rhizobium sp. CNPSo 4039]MDK4717626.1 class II histone deacetylase [Rhizobium sp. CNPSo 4039]